jgi:hypothetical protein
MPNCPKCGSETHRSRARGVWERFRKQLTCKRPYRCHNCEWRGWAEGWGPKFVDLESGTNTAENAAATRALNSRIEVDLDGIDARDRRRSS